MSKRHWWVAAVIAMLGLAGPWPVAQAANSAAAGVGLKASLASGQPVGTTITWTASASGLRSPVYRFAVAAPGGPSLVVRDFSPSPSITWTPLHEGVYTVQAFVQDGFSAPPLKPGGSAYPAPLRGAATFIVRSRVTGTRAVVSPTSNPLVALYSAPACSSGTVAVQYRPAAGSSSWQSTAAQPCQAGQSINVFVAGLRAGAPYVLRHVVTSGSHRTAAASLPFTTGTPPAGLKITTFTVKQAPAAGADRSAKVIFHSLIPVLPPNVANPVATDLSGHLVWYYDTLHSGLTTIWPVHIVAGGTVLLFGQDRYATADDVLREVDLAGNPVRETNIAAVNMQLGRLGQEPIYAFHHDALRLPNGDTAVLGGTQIRSNGQNVTSDMIIVLDQNLQVVWTWDVVDHMAPPKAFPPGTPRGQTPCCAPDPNAIDWTHANGLAWSPQDGNLILSLRQSSQVLKIAYQNGHGPGTVLWRLGLGGDFTAHSADPFPWFSGQHNATLVDPTTMVVFDDGIVRCQGGKVKGCQSRGQEWKLDEAHHVATPVVNVNLGHFWLALGSAQMLPNGNLTFAGGYAPPSGESEFRPNGTQVYALDSPVPVYRAYRLTGLSF